MLGLDIITMLPKIFDANKIQQFRPEWHWRFTSKRACVLQGERKLVFSSKRPPHGMIAWDGATIWSLTRRCRRNVYQQRISHKTSLNNDAKKTYFSKILKSTLTFFRGQIYRLTLQRYAFDFTLMPVILVAFMWSALQHRPLTWNTIDHTCSICIVGCTMAFQLFQ